MTEDSIYQQFINCVYEDDDGTALDWSVPISRSQSFEEAIAELNTILKPPSSSTLVLLKRENDRTSHTAKHLILVTRSVWDWVTRRPNVCQLVVRLQTTQSLPFTFQGSQPVPDPLPYSSSQASDSVSDTGKVRLNTHPRTSGVRKKSLGQETRKASLTKARASLELRMLQSHGWIGDIPRHNRRRPAGQMRERDGEVLRTSSPIRTVQHQRRTRDTVHRGSSCRRCLREGLLCKFTRIHPLATRCDGCAERGKNIRCDMAGRSRRKRQERRERQDGPSNHKTEETRVKDSLIPHSSCSPLDAESTSPAPSSSESQNPRLGPTGILERILAGEKCLECEINGRKCTVTRQGEDLDYCDSCERMGGSDRCVFGLSRRASSSEDEEVEHEEDQESSGSEFVDEDSK